MDRKDKNKHEDHEVTPLQEPAAEAYGMTDPNVIDNLSFERIPGLAYTYEERIAAVKETMAEIRAGVPGMDSEEVYERLQELYKKDPDSEELERIIDNLPFERIPGLPYTHEERMASLRRAEEQWKLGLFISSDELDEEMKKW